MHFILAGTGFIVRNTIYFHFNGSILFQLLHIDLINFQQVNYFPPTLGYDIGHRFFNKLFGHILIVNRNLFFVRFTAIVIKPGQARYFAGLFARGKTLVQEVLRTASVECPAKGKFCLRANSLFTFGTKLTDGATVFARKINKSLHQCVGCFYALVVRFQHMAFGHKRKGMKQGAKAGAIAGTVPKCRPAFFGCFAKRVYVGNEVITFIFHACIQAWFKLGIHKVAHSTAQFIMLCGKQGHYMLVVGSIAYMIVYKNIGVEQMEYFCKSARIA